VERWEVKPEFAGTAQALFVRAVSSSFDVEQGRAQTRALFRHERAPVASTSRRQKEQEEEDGPSLRDAAPLASVGDLAESLFEIIRKAEDPLAVAERLLSIVRVKCPRCRPSFAS
jgi:hypothetical protein